MARFNRVLRYRSGLSRGAGAKRFRAISERCKVEFGIPTGGLGFLAWWGIGNLRNSKRDGHFHEIDTAC